MTLRHWANIEEGVARHSLSLLDDQAAVQQRIPEISLKYLERWYISCMDETMPALRYRFHCIDTLTPH